MLSNKSKSLRKSEKELKSFKNKLGKNLIWFNSLSTRKQYDILFMWKREKWAHKGAPKKSIKYIKRKKVLVENNLPRLSHWIRSFKYSWRFRPTKKGMRNATIDSIIGK